MKLENDTYKTEVKNLVKTEKQVTLPKSSKKSSEPPEKKLKLTTLNGSKEGSEQDHTTNSSNQSDTAAEIAIDIIPGYLSAKLYSNVNLTHSSVVFSNSKSAS